MTEEEKKLLSNFETKLRHLIYLHDELRVENEELRQRLDEAERRAEQLKAENEQLEITCADLKTATAIGIGGDNAKEAKLRIDKLVREIDICIAQLE
jgi:regulator of replication initiation timing